MTLKEQISWCKSQVKKGYEVIPITSIMNRLKSMEKIKDPPHEYHNHAVEAYKRFLEGFGLPGIVDGRQGAALKELLPKLQTLTATKSPEGAFNALKFILDNWKRASNYHQSKKTLVHINNNLVELLDQIRNGADKKQSNRNQAEQLANTINRKQQGRSS